MNARERAALAAEQGDSATAAYWTRIAEVVDKAPPLSPEQKSILSVLLRPDPTPATSARAAA